MPTYFTSKQAHTVFIKQKQKLLLEQEPYRNVISIIVINFN
jgi:hypothetical protein